jgi:hypothetical protein
MAHVNNATSSSSQSCLLSGLHTNLMADADDLHVVVFFGPVLRGG